MPNLKKYPFYLRSTVILFGLVLCSYALANLRGILIPFSFALFLAILLNPLVDRLQQWKVPKVAAILLALAIAIVVIAGIWYFLATQMMHFTDQLPVLERKTDELVSKLQHELSSKIPLEKQNQYIGEAKAGIKPLVGQLLGSVMGTLTTVFLLPVYTFLMIYYKTLMLNFLYDIFAEENAREVSTVLRQVKGAIQSYMYGLLIEGLIVAALNTLALVILGVPYAILLGVLGALLNVLPRGHCGAVAGDSSDHHKGWVQYADRNYHQLYYYPVYGQSLSHPLYSVCEGEDQCTDIDCGGVAGRCSVGVVGNVFVDTVYRGAEDRF